MDHNSGSEEKLNNKNLDLNNIADLKHLLLNKYQNIIGTCCENNLSIEDIVESVVHYYESIISCMPGNVYWLDKNGVALGCNKNVLKMFGFKSIVDFKGLTFKEMGKLGGWSQSAIISFEKDTLDVINTRKARLNIEEPVIPDGDGKLISFLTSRVPLFDHVGSVIAVVGISIDISDRKNMEEVLKEAKEKAEAANKAKTAFLENISHDIRTPLSGIVGFAELLNSDNNKESIKEFTEGLVQSSRELLRFLNEVIESINVASGEIPLLKKTFNLQTKIFDVISLHKAKAFEKGLNLDFVFDKDIPKYVVGDPVRIYRIVLELIGNALKFTKQGYVRVCAKLAKKNEFKIIVKIEIEDTGPGIPKEKQQEIFIRFKRLIPSYDGVYNGSGLGLFIAKQFIDDLEGEIHVESYPGKGTKFICLIPMRGSLSDESFGDDECVVDHALFNETLVNLPLQTSVDIKQRNHILVVEDHVPTSIVIKNMLNSFGFSVDVAPDGQTAIDFFKNNHYVLILMDIGLPDINGYEVTKKIRLYETPSKNAVPIVALTAHVSIEEKQQCLEASMNAVFTKPLFKDKIIDIVDTFVPDHFIKKEASVI